MVKNILLVAFGGAVGSIFRYLNSFVFSNKNFPFSTFIVNIVGCFFIGLLMGYIIKQQNAQTWQMLLVTGFCGGFTTFSAFSYDAVLLFQQQRVGVAFLYVLGTLILGVISTFSGLLLTK